MRISMQGEGGAGKGLGREKEGPCTSSDGNHRS